MHSTRLPASGGIQARSLRSIDNPLPSGPRMQAVTVG